MRHFLKKLFAWLGALFFGLVVCLCGGIAFYFVGQCSASAYPAFFPGVQPTTTTEQYMGSMKTDSITRRATADVPIADAEGYYREQMLNRCQRGAITDFHDVRDEKTGQLRREASCLIKGTNFSQAALQAARAQGDISLESQMYHETRQDFTVSLFARSEMQVDITQDELFTTWC